MHACRFGKNKIAKIVYFRAVQDGLDVVEMAEIVLFKIKVLRDIPSINAAEEG